MITVSKNGSLDKISKVVFFKHQQIVFPAWSLFLHISSISVHVLCFGKDKEYDDEEIMNITHVERADRTTLDNLL